MFDIQIAMYIKKNKLTNFSAAIIFAKYRLDLSSQTPTTTPYFRFLEYQNQKNIENSSWKWNNIHITTMTNRTHYSLHILHLLPIIARQ